MTTTVREKSMAIISGAGVTRELRVAIKKLNKELAKKGLPPYWLSPEFLEVIAQMAPIKETPEERTYTKYWQDIVRGETLIAERALR
jgi:hypothetical protein